MRFKLKYKCAKCGMEYGEEPSCCWHNSCYSNVFINIDKEYEAQ